MMSNYLLRVIAVTMPSFDIVLRTTIDVLSSFSISYHVHRILDAHLGPSRPGAVSDEMKSAY
jgi:hypothetical protein